ncbi:type VII secretion target [Streptomyces sp. LHD-70]|uniref:WXG100 family type VII secretion target n=1 Tax=Streptomyces sp. LHD-70 TaxID=3072140 RepID=UPI002810040C|nr:type VII secretion target [Streptomyces sp. LHD-70]MDQ8702011.1 type VII secretion target [Streptomyces sp. LHD-70]
MSDGTGYGIRAGQVGTAAGRLDTAADELDTVKSIIPPDLSMPPEVMGGEEAAPAFNAFAEAWQREATVLRDALREISGKLNTTTNNYAAAEQGAETQLRRAAPARAGLSDFN